MPDPTHRPPTGTTAPPHRPAKGSFVVDTARNRVGQVMDHLESRVQLRPVQGGLEWDARPEDVRPASSAEVLSAKVKAVNAAGRTER
ncbi:hypothetical protein ACIHFE_17395 [Streptomyces sp. NPDC052396]|uniref:hypothetical protein n=1 Tax=Streptomyces sp. NPDC052396 TaxID=3365689 RepID=UPI0037D79D56